MVTRTKPYIVGIKNAAMPKTGLSVLETLLALDKVIERFVRKHKGHPKLVPELPFVTLTLSSGKEVCGLLRQATENSVAIFPQGIVAQTESGYKHYGIHYNSPVVVNPSSVDMVRTSFRSHEVYPRELSA